MCGICGTLTIGGRGADEGAATAVVRRMADTMTHRGPDAYGEWASPGAEIALAHRRLSIIDLSAFGAQPMASACGRYICIYNGEIYNHVDLRRILEMRGHVFRGRSDTEVLLAAVAEWGVIEALERLNGMFALAVWDTRERELFLARDRMGEKPLYYAWLGDSLVFASELKALRAHPEAGTRVDRDALAAYMRHGYVPAPLTILEGVFKLPQGSYLQVPARPLGREAKPERYWSLSDVAAEGLGAPAGAPVDELEEELDVLLRDAVRSRTIADVGIGVFLSGGIDSSLVAALMQAQSSSRVRSFSIGFRQERYDEAPFARAVAQHLGTDHTELYVDIEDARAIVPDLPGIYDEPFGDSSAIPTIILSRLTRRHVTVALSGDGGDELFAGYTRYQSAGHVWRRARRVPSPIRRSLAAILRSGSATAWDSMLAGPLRLLPRALRSLSPGRRVAQLAAALGAHDATEFYDAFTAQWMDADLVHTEMPPRAPMHGVASLRAGDFISRAMYQDTSSYMPDDVLVKVDRASMAASLEVRVPLLDHRVVRFAWRVPTTARVHRGAGKWLLRRVLARYVPARLTERPKSGFAVPVDEWLRGPLREWADDLLDPSLLARDGFLNPGRVAKAWGEHRSGARNWRDPLWIALMFQAWLHASGR